MNLMNRAARPLANRESYGQPLIRTAQHQSGPAAGAACCCRTPGDTQAANTATAVSAKPTVTAGNAQMTLAWTSPVNGGSAITRYACVKKVGTNVFEGSWTQIPRGRSGRGV